jgi:CheY-like chemotaxis protein
MPVPALALGVPEARRRRENVADGALQIAEESVTVTGALGLPSVLPDSGIPANSWSTYLSAASAALLSNLVGAGLLLPTARQQPPAACRRRPGPGFTQVLSNRLDTLGWDLRALSAPIAVDALVGMRLNALVVDLAVLGPGSWEYLERVCSRLPGLAVIVCTGPSSVAQRVRGLRLGADAWMTKPCHAEELICVIEAAIRRHRRNEMPSLRTPLVVGEITIRPDLYQAYVGDASASS